MTAQTINDTNDGIVADLASEAQTSPDTQANRFSKRPPRQGSLETLVQWLSESPLRCHAGGAMLSCALLLLIGWSVFRSEFLSPTNHIDHAAQLEDELTLIRSQAKWRMRFQNLVDTRNELRDHVRAIGEWLPSTVDSSAAVLELEEQASERGLRVLDSQAAETHHGSRIAVLSVQLQLEGSYEAICRYIDHLAKRPRPLWCNAIRIERKWAVESSDPVKDSEVTADDDAPLCVVHLSLRIPFTGPPPGPGQNS